MRKTPGVVPFELWRNIIGLELFSGRRRLSAVLDTGAGQTLISDAAARGLGLSFTRFPPPPAHWTTEDRVFIGAGRCSGLRLGATVLPELDFSVLRAGIMSRRMGRKIDIILGRDVLRGFRTTIDYGLKRLEVADPAARSALPPLKPIPGAKLSEIVLPFKERHHLVVLRGLCGGRALSIVLDTGAGDNVLSATMAAKLGVKYSKDARSVSGIARDFASRLGTLRDLRLGKLKLPFLYVDVHDLGHMDSAFGFKADMILGTPFLSMFRTSIDYSSRRVSLSLYGIDEKKAGKTHEAA